MRNFIWALALAAGALLACQSKSPEEDLLQQAKPAGSWIATLRFAGERWIANSVPLSFVKSTADQAKDEISKVADEAGKSKARPERRLPLQQLMQETQEAGHSLERAAEAGNRPEAARQVGRLAALQGELNAWQGQGEGK